MIIQNSNRTCFGGTLGIGECIGICLKLISIGQNLDVSPLNLTCLLEKIPDEFKPIVDGVFQNILIGAIAQTDEQKEAMIAKMQAARQQQQQTQGEEPTEGMPDNEEQDEMEEQPETEEQPDSQQQPEMVA